jgi:hypothetical protein
MGFRSCQICPASLPERSLTCRASSGGATKLSPGRKVLGEQTHRPRDRRELPYAQRVRELEKAPSVRVLPVPQLPRTSSQLSWVAPPALLSRCSTFSRPQMPCPSPFPPQFSHFCNSANQSRIFKNSPDFAILNPHCTNPSSPPLCTPRTRLKTNHIQSPIFY